MNNRGGEWTMNIIIIASIGLLVLVILSVLVINSIEPSSIVDRNITVNESEPMFRLSNDTPDNYSYLTTFNITSWVEPTFVVIINDTPIFSMDGNATKFVMDNSSWVEVTCDNVTLFRLNPDVNNTRCFVRRFV